MHSTWRLPLLMGIVGLASGSAGAQSLTEVLQRGRSQAARLAPSTGSAGFECAYEALDYTGAEPVRRTGKLYFRAPDQCRVVTEPGVGLPGGRMTVCSGAATLSRIPNSGRAQRYYRNLFVDWATGFAGPANFAAFGLLADQLTREYSVIIQPGPPTEGKPTVTLTLNELRPRERLIKDHVDAGGEDIQIAYLAYKRRVYLRPPRVRVTIDPERWLVVKREQFDSTESSARPSRVDTLAAAREVTPGVWFPERYETRNAEGALLATYAYRDVRAGAAQEATLYALNYAGDEMPEDAELQTIDVYRQQLDGRSKDALINFAAYYMQWHEDPVEAIKYLSLAEEANPNSVAPRALRAQLFAATARYAEAAEQWSRVREARPNYPGVNALLARALLANKDRAGAIAAFTAQVQKEPADWLSRVTLGELHMQDGDYDRARELYEGALAPTTSSVLGRLQAAEDLVMLSRWRQQLTPLTTRETGPDPVLIKLKGDALLLSGDAKAAVAEFSRIPATPATNPVRQAAAQSLERGGLLDEARALYQELSALGVDTALGAYAVRRLLALDAAAGRLDPALAALTRLLNAEPSLAARMQLRGAFIQFFQKSLRLEQLVAALETKSRATPPDELASLLLVDAYPQIRRGDQALELLRSGPARFPRSAWWHSRLAALLVAEAREKFPLDFNNPGRLALLRSARDATDRAIAAEPNLYYEAQRVFVYDAARTPQARQQAQAAAQEILRRYPTDPDAQMVRAVLERTQKLSEPSAPIAFYRSILDVGTPFEDRHQELYFLRQSLADAYKRAGRFDEAYRQYLLLLDTSRNNAERLQMSVAILFTAGQQKNTAQAASTVVDLYLRLLRRKDTKGNREAVLGEVLEPAQFETLTKSQELRPLVQQELGRRLQAAPNDPYLFLLAGRMVLSEGKLDEEKLTQAAELHERAAEAAAQDPDLDAWLAEVWALKKTYIGAAERLERALARDPVRLVDYFTLANLYVSLKRLNDAKDLPQKMLLRLPSDTYTLRAAGSLYLKHLGRYDLASQFYREAHRLSLLDPAVSAFDTVDLLVYLARAEALNGQFAAAESKFRELADKAELGKAVRVDAHVVLAEMYFEAKRYNDCIAALKKARDLQPPAEVVKDLDEKIKKVEELAKGGK